VPGLAPNQAGSRTFLYKLGSIENFVSRGPGMGESAASTETFALYRNVAGGTVASEPDERWRSENRFDPAQCDEISTRWHDRLCLLLGATGTKQSSSRESGAVSRRTHRFKPRIV
jgi:hypothetical protein